MGYGHARVQKGNSVFARESSTVASQSPLVFARESATAANQGQRRDRGLDCFAKPRKDGRGREDRRGSQRRTGKGRRTRKAPGRGVLKKNGGAWTDKSECLCICLNKFAKSSRYCGHIHGHDKERRNSKTSVRLIFPWNTNLEN